MRSNARFDADVHHRRLERCAVLDSHLQEQLLIGPLLETNDVFSLNDLGLAWCRRFPSMAHPDGVVQVICVFAGGRGRNIRVQVKDKGQGGLPRRLNPSESGE